MDARRPTVVLLHSSAASRRQWDALAQQLRPTFAVHAPDLHGHGRQPPWPGPQALRLADEAALVWPLLQAAGGAHLVGHSYGAALALHLACTQPSLVRSLVVFEPPLFRLLIDHEPQGAAAREACALGAQVRERVEAGQTMRAAARFVDYWTGEGAWAQLPEERRQGLAARMPSVARHFDALYHEAVTPTRVGGLRMPVLLLGGEHSPRAVRRIAALLRERLPGARREVLDGAGHMAPLTHAAQVNERIASFLQWAGRVSPAEVAAAS